MEEKISGNLSNAKIWCTISIILKIFVKKVIKLDTNAYAYNLYVIWKLYLMISSYKHFNERSCESREFPLESYRWLKRENRQDGHSLNSKLNLVKATLSRIFRSRLSLLRSSYILFFLPLSSAFLILQGGARTNISSQRPHRDSR